MNGLAMLERLLAADPPASRYKTHLRNVCGRFLF
jgi:hypothetical protein